MYANLELAIQCSGIRMFSEDCIPGGLSGAHSVEMSLIAAVINNASVAAKQ